MLNSASAIFSCILHFAADRKQLVTSISGRSVGLTGPDKRVKFCDPRLNHSKVIRSKAAGCGILGRFSKFGKFQPEVAGDIISCVTLVYVGVDVHAKFDDSRLNSGLIIRLWLSGPILQTFVQYLIAFCS